MALPQCFAAAGTIVSRSIPSAAVPAQSAISEGSLPAARYLELRTQTLGHARLIAGPRLKNPNLASGGLDRDIATALAEQRANRLSRAGIPSPPTGAGALLPARSETLLPSPTSIPFTQQTGSSSPREPALKRSSCTFPAVHAVNGRTINPVFTPAEPDNHFRITGCGFGSAPGQVRLQPSLADTSLRAIALQLETPGSWTDTYIDVRMDPRLTGIPDFTADLVIQLPNGRSIQVARCQFLATRGEPQLLHAIPAAWVRLDATSLSARAIHQIEFASPPVGGAETPPDAAGASAFIARSDAQAFTTGKDVYDLSQLAPGWVIESVQLRVFSAACPGESKTPVSSGSWETSWSRNGFIVAWAGETCSSPIPPVFNFTLSSSQYATNVWVVGPIGTQPLPNTMNARQP